MLGYICRFELSETRVESIGQNSSSNFLENPVSQHSTPNVRSSDPERCGVDDRWTLRSIALEFYI